MAANKEMISKDKFDESVKNMVLEFYCYGFKTMDEMGGRSKFTNKNNMDRLRKILDQFGKDDETGQKYMTWVTHGNKSSFTTMDSLPLPTNPFHNVYRFCDCRESFQYMLRAFTVLSPKIQLREEYRASNPDLENYENEMLTGPASEKNNPSGIPSIDALKEYGLKTSEFLMCCSREFSQILAKSPNPETVGKKKRNSSVEGRDENGELPFKDSAASGTEYRTAKEEQNLDTMKRNAENALERLCAQGILRCEQKEGKRGGAGDKRWILNPLTINEIIQEGEKADPEFKAHFISALDFYSRYFVIGEAGTFMLDRLKADDSGRLGREKSFLQNSLQSAGSAGEKYESPFRFRQEYFIQSLNDYDILDLLGAMETDDWCLIEYRHGFAGKTAENVTFLCYPLEIRISTVNGREYLMYYEPVLRSCMSLRLDFIHNISLVPDQEVRKVLKNKKYTQSDDKLDSDIIKAQEMLDHIWGVSTAPGNELAGNIDHIEDLHDVRMTIKYDPVDEPYIETRLNREKRNGFIKKIPGTGSEECLEFNISLYDPQEMNSWIYSFASRITSLERDWLPPSKGASRDEIRQKINEESRQNRAENFKKWEVKDEITESLENGKKAEQHNLIFNDIFSVYAQILATILTYMLSVEEWENEDEWKKIFRSWRDKIIESSDTAGCDTGILFGELFSADTIQNLFLFKDERGKLLCKYELNEKKLGKDKDQVSVYRDILPLTEIEVRWLKTILKDTDKINCFLSEKEIKAVSQILDEKRPWETELPVDKIVYFDRYKFPDECRNREKKTVRKLLDIISKNEKAKITFKAVPNDRIHSDVSEPFEKDDGVTAKSNFQEFTGKFIPLNIIFSKRNNFFTLWFLSCEDNKIYIINASRILSIEETGERISREEKKTARERLDEYFKQEKTTVTLKFSGKKNSADRILLLLSPWEKKCTYNPEAEDGLPYSLELAYLKSDEQGLAIRLLGYTYGKNGLLIEPSSSGLAQEIARRKRVQDKLYQFTRERSAQHKFILNPGVK